MNPSSHDTESIRSDINVTRQRMDDTMDALGDRLQPRHLLDEVLGFLRGNSEGGESRFREACHKVTNSTGSALQTVADTVKKNPMPALVIGAGVAWMIYESRREKMRDGSVEDERDDLSQFEREELSYDPELHYDRPLEYPPRSEEESKWSGEDESGAEHGEKIGEKASEIAENVREKISHAGDVAREKAGALRQRAGRKIRAVKARAGEMGQRVKEGTRDAYARTRERVVTTGDQHPLEVGLAALAAGLVAGLLLPTPNLVNRTVGPAADRVRSRTRQAGTEILEKGKRVAEAALGAVKAEAEAQGLTPDRLREKARPVAEKGKEAGQETAAREGLTDQTGKNSPLATNDPSVARPM